MSGRVGNRGRDLSTAAIIGLGIEGAGELSPGTLDTSAILATRDHVQDGFGAYNISCPVYGDSNLAGAGFVGTVIVGAFLLTSHRNDGFENRLLSLASQINLDAAGALALNGVRCQYELVYFFNGSIQQPIMIHEFAFNTAETIYNFNPFGGGNVNPAIGLDTRLSGFWPGWVPANVQLQVNFRLETGAFPANTVLKTASMSVQQPRFNKPPW